MISQTTVQEMISAVAESWQRVLTVPYSARLSSQRKTVRASLFIVYRETITLLIRFLFVHFVGQQHW